MAKAIGCFTSGSPAKSVALKPGGRIISRAASSPESPENLGCCASAVLAKPPSQRQSSAARAGMKAEFFFTRLDDLVTPETMQARKALHEKSCAKPGRDSHVHVKSCANGFGINAIAPGSRMIMTFVASGVRSRWGAGSFRFCDEQIGAVFQQGIHGPA